MYGIDIALGTLFTESLNLFIPGQRALEEYEGVVRKVREVAAHAVKSSRKQAV